MSQHDMDIADQAINTAFPDVTLALKALASNNMGASAPSTTYAGMLWSDTTNDLLKIRDKADGAWITLGEYDYSNGRFELSANVFHALTTAGFSFKNAGGAVLFAVSNTGVFTLITNAIPLDKVAAATTTGRGSVEKATTAEAEGGTVADKYPDVVGVKAARDNDRFTSSAQTITSAGSLTIAHGLSAAPTVVTAWIKCLTADGGYSVGDEVFVVVQGASNEGSSSNKGVSIVRDATNLTVRFGSSASTFQPLNKSTGVAYTSFVNARWEIYFHAML